MIGFSDDEALAAEYALGTLDQAEWAIADSRRRADKVFDGLVRDWETRLAPLITASPELAPPAELLNNLLSRLAPVHMPAANDNGFALRRQLRVWRGIAAIASALAALLAVWIVQREAFAPPAASQNYVAVLQEGSNTPSFVVSLDLANRRMAVMPLGTSTPADKSFELWMIGADQGTPPQSIGVIDGQTAVQPHLPDIDRNVISKATYAVTLEPRGGSPTGKPTSAPIFIGKLIHTAL